MDDSKMSIKFFPFTSAIDGSFWESFSKYKLNDMKLRTDPVQIFGIYSRCNKLGIPPLFNIQYNFNKEPDILPGEIRVCGSLINVNTIEDFKNADKTSLIGDVGSQVWSSIISGEAESDPSLLNRFLMYIYADLKKYHYYYWFAFPAFMCSSSFSFTSTKLLSERLPPSLVRSVAEALDSCNLSLEFFVLVIQENESVEIKPLSFYHDILKTRSQHKLKEVWICFSDPSTSEHPGWPLRNLLTLASVRWRDEPNHTVLVLRQRIVSNEKTFDHSLVLSVEISIGETPSQMPPCVGWEKNERGKLGPKFCNMAKSMDPTRIAESAVELNLRLMKWRLDPFLDLDAIKNCKCLLFGAGTLGCNVARALLGWGVRGITLVDIGRVSYSNPVRQSLFAFEDCLGEATMKAPAAARALARIFPRVEAEGVVLSIPMPGHPVSEGQIEEVTKDVEGLEALVESHDALFLLTDSRESRWLPSLLGASKRKIVLTAALGFDSYLVMRHGSHVPGLGSSEASPDSLGCYFCNDVVAPGNSTRDRTLDQQCTVTRPGVSFMAAGQIVEMLVDILQYSGRLKNGESPPPLRHSIRYYLGRMDQLLTTSPAFKNCSACSPAVISEYREHGKEFLFQVLNKPKYLEEVSGLAKLHEESQEAELFELSDSEDMD